MKILLINPICREWALPNVFPLGLGYIASVLRNNGHEVIINDSNASRKAFFRFEKDIDLIGITGIITQYQEIKTLSKAMKYLYSNAPIICGGSLATSVPELLLKKTNVDACVLGEGEKVILDIIKDIKNNNLKQIYKADKTIKYLELISWPAYDLFLMDVYLKNPIAYYNTNKWVDGKNEIASKSMNMIGSRGCLFNCQFCYHCYMGDGYRARPAYDIVNEMFFLQDKYNVSYIHFCDDAFASIPKNIIEFCQRKTIADWGNSKMPLKWSCAGRANIMNEDLAKRMKDAGCIGICYGIESGSQKILDEMNKKVTLDQYRRAIELNHKYFEYQDYTAIVGSISESDKTVQESISFFKEMGIKPSAVFYLTPYPGTRLFNRLAVEHIEFRDMINDVDKFENWISNLNEQGEKIAWNCSSHSDEKLREWKQKFVEEAENIRD